MPGHSDHVGPFDELAKVVCSDGISRRHLVKLVGGFVLAALIPSRARAAGPPSPSGASRVHPDIKASGHCPAPADSATAPYYTGVCGLDEFFVLDKHDTVVGCKGDWIPAGLGATSTFNGCGPEGGIDLPIFGRGDYVPDRPFGVVNFFSACKNHDCCYGSCTSAKSTCDDNFMHDMLKACVAAYPSADSVIDAVGFGLCASLAGDYTLAVSKTATGTNAYNAAKSPWCACCVSCEQSADILGQSYPDHMKWCGDAVQGGCTDIMTDESNCGSCGTVCGADGSNNTACCNGVCVSDYVANNSPCYG